MVRLYLKALASALLFSQAVLLNPRSGVQIFRHTTITTTRLNEYHEKFNALVKKIFRNWWRRFTKGQITTDPAIMQAAEQRLAMINAYIGGAL